MTALVFLLQERKCTGDELARRFEISRRTVMRDVQALCEIGLPVIAEWGPNGGYSLPGGSVQPLTLTRGEAFYLLLALRALGSGGSLGGAATGESLTAKVRALIPETLRHGVERIVNRVNVGGPAGPREGTAQHLEAVLAAVGDEVWIEVSYTSTRGPSIQTLRPELLSLEEGFWYLRAYSMERGEVRTYRVDRIGSLRALEKSSEVELELKQGRSGSPTPGYGDPSLPEVVIALTRRGAMEADRSFPETPVRHEPEGPRIRVRCPPREYHWFARAVLGMGGEATAVEPAPFVSLVRRLAADVAVRHGGPPESPALGNKSAADRKGGSDMNLDGDMRPGSASG